MAPSFQGGEEKGGTFVLDTRGKEKKGIEFLFKIGMKKKEKRKMMIFFSPK